MRVRLLRIGARRAGLGGWSLEERAGRVGLGGGGWENGTRMVGQRGVAGRDGW